MSSRSSNDRYLPDGGFAAGLHIAGGIPPASRNHLVPTGCDTPALNAATSLLIPAAMSVQNSCRSLRVATGGRPGDRNGGRPHRSDRRFFLSIATFSIEVLRRPLESAQFTSAEFTGTLLAKGIAISMDGKGAWRDNVLVERLWRTIKYEEVYLHAYDTVSDARGSLGRYIDFYNSRRPHSSLDRQPPDRAYFNRPSLLAAA